VANPKVKWTTGSKNFAMARQALSKGDFLQLRIACKALIKENPNDSRAHSMLGAGYLKQKQIDKSQFHLNKALKLFPNDVGANVTLGQIYLQKRRFAEAETYFRRASANASDDIEILRFLSLSLLQQVKFDDAIQVLDKLLLISHEDADAFNKKGFAKIQLGDVLGGIANCSRALLLNRNFPEAWNNRGTACLHSGQLQLALSDFQHAVELRQSYPNALLNLAGTNLALQRTHDALETARWCVDRLPNTPRSHLLLGLARLQDRQFASAMECILKSLQMEEDQPDAMLGLAEVQLKSGDIEECTKTYEKLLKLHPSYPDAVYKLGELDLIKGDYVSGWKKLEKRLAATSFANPPSLSGVELWQGENLEDKSIAVIAEKSLVDTVQFSRYLPILADQAKQVVFVVSTISYSLFKHLDPRVLLIEQGTPLQNIDFQCSVLNLPHRFDDGLKDIVEQIGYLAPLPANEFAGTKSSNIDSRKVGIALYCDGVHGEPARDNISNQLAISGDIKDLELTELRFIQEVVGEAWKYQKGKIVYASSEPQTYRDYGQYAATLRQMDLIIARDNETAHIAAAMGIPVWLLLDPVPNWRWMLKGEGSHWYPTIRLFRRCHGENWSNVLYNIETLLEEFFRSQNDEK